MICAVHVVLVFCKLCEHRVNKILLNMSGLGLHERKFRGTGDVVKNF